MCVCVSFWRFLLVALRCERVNQIYFCDATDSCTRTRTHVRTYAQAELADDVEVDESATGKTGLDAYSEYLSRAGAAASDGDAAAAGGGGAVVYDEHLGLAIEALPAGMTTPQLWSLFPEDDD